MISLSVLSVFRSSLSVRSLRTAAQHASFFFTYYRVSQKKGIDKKTFIRSCSQLQFTVFEFIWIQYICKFCAVFHLKDLDASR